MTSCSVIYGRIVHVNTEHFLLWGRRQNMLSLTEQNSKYIPHCITYLNFSVCFFCEMFVAETPQSGWMSACCRCLATSCQHQHQLISTSTITLIIVRVSNSSGLFTLNSLLNSVRLRFLQRDVTQSAVLLRQVVCLSVRDVEVSWSHWLEFVANNFTVR